jgi:RNA polymerase sigma factor (sigma-70 family)
MPHRSPEAVLPHLRRLVRSWTAGDLTDGQLLERFRSRRDPEAFAALVRRHGPMVLGVCRRVLNNAHDAEDAFQATFLVLVRKARSIAKQEAVGSWLYGVAYRVAHKARAEAARRCRHERRVATLAARPSEGEEAGEGLRLFLDAEVSRLPEKYRQPIVLCYFEGRTYAEAARLLGWPAGTVAARLARARKVLRSRLARRGLALTSGAVATGWTEGAASASVLSLLVNATVQAALQLAAGRGAAGVPTHVVALTEGVIQAMLLQKLKALAGVVLAVVLLCGGAGALYRLGGPPPAAAADRPIPASEDIGTPQAPVADVRGQAPAEAEKAQARPLAPPIAPGANRAPQPTRVGLINMTQVFKASKRFQAVQAEVRTRTKQLQEEQETLKAKLQKYQADSSNPGATAQRREQAARRQRELQRQIEDERQDAQRELGKLTGEAFTRMYREVEDAANRIAKAYGLDLVMFYTDAVTEADFYNPANLQRKLTQPGVLMPLVVAPGMDITDTVVEALNRRAAAPEGGRR